MAATPKNQNGEADIRRDRDRFVAFAFASADAFLELDEDLAVRYGAGAVRWLLGRDLQAGGADRLTDLVDPADARLVAAACRMAKTQQRFGPLQIAFQRAGAKPVHVELSGTYLTGADGASYYVAVRARSPEQTALSQANAAETPATGEEARAAFGQVAADIVKAASDNGRAVDLTLFDLKNIDALRPTLGDEEVADLTADIEAHLTSCALGPSSVSKVGDAEYGLLHDRTLKVDDLTKTIEALTADRDPSGEGISLRTVTVDVTDADMSDTEFAKAVVYCIEQFSKGKSEFTINDLNQGFREMMEDVGPRVAEVKRIIRDRSFDLAFQPIVDLEDRAVHHHEVLVRFHGKSSPYETITLSEKLGLSPAHDLAICQKTIDVMKESRAAGRLLSLAVNLSGRSLESAMFVQRLHALLRAAEGFREHLLFEVTESAEIHDLETTSKVLQSLRDLKHKVCLDDFGAGASAFQYLRTLPVDFVKIDGSYIRPLTKDADKRAFVKSMTALCRDLKIETIGEMIEDEATVGALREVGVDFGQGYHFGRPTTDRPR